MHWAERLADELIAENPGKEEFLCAAGTSPSGSVHIGNFRDIATPYFVVKALRKMAYEGYLQKRESSIFECKEINSRSDIKAKDIFSAANNGDQFAIEIINSDLFTM